MISFVHTILYVADQARSTAFYRHILALDPVLEVPGMTEFLLAPHTKLGLMPNAGIAKILCPLTPHPHTGTGIPRCELYLYVSDIQYYFDNALRYGAQPISPIQPRNWGDTVGYVMDADGHIIAFAQSA